MSGSVSTWIQQISNGDQKNLPNLWKRFWNQISEKAEGFLVDKSSNHFDHEDVASVAFDELICLIAEGNQEIKNRRRFIKLLNRSVARTADEFESNERTRRLKHNESHEALERLAENQRRRRIAIQFEEELEVIAQNCDAQARQILDFLRQGYHIDEIALEMGVNSRTVRRRIDSIKEVITKNS